MALIKCPECEKEVSDTAKICPNCGFYMKKGKKTKKILNKKIIIGICIAIAIILIYIIYGHFSMINAISGIYERELYTNSDGEEIGIIIEFEEDSKSYTEVVYNKVPSNIKNIYYGKYTIGLFSIELKPENDYGTTELVYNPFTHKFSNAKLHYTQIEE